MTDHPSSAPESGRRRDPAHDRVPDAGGERPRVLSGRRRRRDRRTTGGAGRIVALVLLLVGGSGAAFWWWTSRPPAPDAGPGTTAPSPSPTTIVGDTTGGPRFEIVSGEPFPDLPVLDESDAWLRDRAAALSPDPRWREWLSADGLVRRLVLAVVNVAAAASPREPLAFLQPSDTFTVVMENGRAWVDPASWRRYDRVVAAITSLDARATARFYRGVAPLTEAEWLPLGFVERDFDDAVREAITVVRGAEVPEGRIELVRDGAVWAYADPRLEELPPATKHLLRLGPDNLLRLQDWARTFAATAGLTN